MKISELEKKMLKIYPAKTACEWDKTGLLVGDKNAQIKKVAIALDPTLAAVKLAKEKGCNLLVTHHPTYLGEIENFLEEESCGQMEGTVIYSAIKNDIALMNFHTALDVSTEGTTILPKMLGLKIGNVLCPTDNLSHAKSKLGFGRVSTLKPSDKNLNLEKLAKRCEKVFGRAPRVWGNKNSKLKTIATSTGSVGRLNDSPSVLAEVINQKIDCIICGEIKYHDALALLNLGISVIDLGHDVSELPLCISLEKSLKACGIQKNKLVMLDQSNNWSN